MAGRESGEVCVCVCVCVCVGWGADRISWSACLLVYSSKLTESAVCGCGKGPNLPLLPSCQPEYTDKIRPGHDPSHASSSYSN